MEISDEFAVLDAGGSIKGLQTMEVSANFLVINEIGEINEPELFKATDEILEQRCSKHINCDQHSYEEAST